jgi:hypothetical protein
MHDKTDRQRPTREIESEGSDVKRRTRNAVAERSAEHQRWIGGDSDDPACRGID